MVLIGSCLDQEITRFFTIILQHRAVVFLKSLDTNRQHAALLSYR